MIDTETPADTIRRAARLMRERANAATPGPWGAYRYIYGDIAASRIISHAKGRVIVAGGAEDPFGGGGVYAHEDADHIASWHPTVVRVVADWLDMWAHSAPWNFLHPINDAAYALDVARTYLGETDD